MLSTGPVKHAEYDTFCIISYVIKTKFLLISYVVTKNKSRHLVNENDLSTINLIFNKSLCHPGTFYLFILIILSSFEPRKYILFYDMFFSLQKQ